MIFTILLFYFVKLQKWLPQLFHPTGLFKIVGTFTREVSLTSDFVSWKILFFIKSWNKTKFPWVILSYNDNRKQRRRVKWKFLCWSKALHVVEKTEERVLFIENKKWVNDLEEKFDKTSLCYKIFQIYLQWWILQGFNFYITFNIELNLLFLLHCFLLWFFNRFFNDFYTKLSWYIFIILQNLIHIFILLTFYNFYLLSLLTKYLLCSDV